MKERNKGMRSKITRFLLAPIAGLAITFSVSATEPKSDYLHGVWTTGGQENCADNTTEKLSFARDGTFKSERFGITDALGFWRLKDDVVQLHLVTSPAHFDDQLKQFKGYFDYFRVRVVVTSIEADKLKVFGLIGDQVKKETLYRCVA